MGVTRVGSGKCVRVVGKMDRFAACPRLWWVVWEINTIWKNEGEFGWLVIS
jgi:hypothetical protein